MRRAFDLICAAGGLVLLSPILAIIALAIKIEDGGPIFYSQLRVGKDLRKFRLFKFRTMVPDADRLGGSVTVPNNPLITRVGRVARKHKLDELPQLLNVIKGDMQLVGARPELVRYVELFRSQYEQILRERPGITDPATLVYSHEENAFKPGDFEEQYVSKILPHKLELSLKHIRHRTFLGDLGIILRTLLRIPLNGGDSKPAQETESIRL